MSKFKTLPIERMIVAELQSKFNNTKIKVADIMEWSTSEKQVDDNLWIAVNIKRKIKSKWKPQLKNNNVF